MMSDYEQPQADETAANQAAATLDPADTLSPAVRRLIKQYELDISGLNGTGPDGRIRVGDVMALIGGRSAADVNAAAGEPDPASADPERAIGTQNPPGAGRPDAHSAWRDSVATTIVFECDPVRILAHCRRHREHGQDVPLAAYFVSVAAAALAEAPALDMQGVPITVADTLQPAALPADLTELSVEQIAERLRRPAHAELSPAPAFVISHHGLAGSLLIQPAILSPNELAVLGIGRIRREVVVRQVNGEEAPRIASRCLITLSFRPASFDTVAANVLLARCIEGIEQWPVDA